MVVPPTAVCTQEELQLLPTETIADGTGGSWAEFLLSPDGQRLALHDPRGVNIVDLSTHTATRLPLEEAYLFFWSGADALMLRSGSRVYENDILSGARTEFAVKWEYNGPDPRKPGRQSGHGFSVLSVALRIAHDDTKVAPGDQRHQTTLETDHRADEGVDRDQQ